MTVAITLNKMLKQSSQMLVQYTREARNLGLHILVRFID